MKHTLFTALACLLAGRTLSAATPAELDQWMKSGGRVTIVDLRSSSHYQRGHIPGAINIPAHVVPAKKLPPLGRVVVYGDGLGDRTDEAVKALNAKPGIQAEALEGGFAAWETWRGVTAVANTSGSGSVISTITWQDLADSKGEGVLLVDNRAPEAPAAKSAAGTAAKNSKPKANLTGLFAEVAPKASVTTNPFRHLAEMKGKRASFAGAPRLLVIVDNDPARAEETAKRVLMAGYRRVAILAGGEEILLRKGKSGLARQGGAASVTLDPAYSPPPVRENSSGK